MAAAPSDGNAPLASASAASPPSDGNACAGTANDSTPSFPSFVCVNRESARRSVSARSFSSSLAFKNRAHVRAAISARTVSTAPRPRSRASSPRRLANDAREISPSSRARIAREAKKGEADDAPTRAPLPREYEHHSPGSVQETDDAVTFAHERAEEREKWAKTTIVHVGEGSRERVRLGVCIGEFHNKLMDRMLEDARVSAEAMGATIDKVVWVPGTYEAPLVVENMLQDPTLDACVVLGYIEKGSTLHGQEMGATFSIIAKQLELEYGKPVGMGIIGPGATAEQAEMRVAYAGNAVRASVRMARTFVPAEEDVETA